MKILALIPARGGSKRLPGKNVRVLGDKPLIVWSIDFAKDAAEICDILVSTDDPATAAICEAAGALVPWLRPVELATDTASSVDVALHALDWYETEKDKVDGLLLLQPTSPLRSPHTLEKAFEIFKKEHGQHAVVSVSPARCHPAWCFRWAGEGMVPFLGWKALGQRSQDLAPAWMLNGSIYLVAPSRLRVDRSFLMPGVRPLVMDKFGESIDIDTPSDFVCCEEALRDWQDSV